jgi:hypothetical protein
MARTRSAGAKATTAQASTPLLAPEPVNPSASAIQQSAGTGAGPSVPEVEHTASGMFEVSLEGLGASTQDIEALRRIRALITDKTVAPSKSKRCGRLRRKRSRPSSRTWLRRTPLQIPSTSTSGKLSVISLCFRVRSLARRRHSKPSLRRLLQHRRPLRTLRTLRRRLSSMPGILCRPCRLSWINGGSRRTHPKGRASTIGRRGYRRRSTSHRRTHRFATSSWYPRSQSSSRARRGPVVSTPTPYPSTTGTTTPKSSS